MENTSATVHKFELAGLGKAPFVFVSFEVKRGPIKLADGSEVGAPGQPMGTCQYCGTGIANCFNVRSADGRKFYVGSDCIAKVGDAGLMKAVKKIVSEATKARKREREAKAEEAAKEVCERLMAEFGEQFKTVPHPRGFSGLSLFDYAQWMMKNTRNFGIVAYELKKVTTPANV